MNTAEDIANIALGLVAGTHKSKGEDEAQMCNGLSVYVEGGRGWEVEEGLEATRDVWLGKGPNARLMAAGRFVQSVSCSQVKSVRGRVANGGAYRGPLGLVINDRCLSVTIYLMCFPCIWRPFVLHQ